MKKIHLFLFMMTLSLSLVACGNSNDKQEKKVEETATLEPEKTEEPTPEPTVEPTETPVETEEPTPEPTEQPKKATKKNVSKKDIPKQIKELIEGSIGENEKINNVTIENGNLFISVELSDPAPFTMADLASSRTSSITDAILDNEDLDQYWETITLDFGETGSKTFTKSDIVTDDSLNIRYFEVDFTEFNE